MCESIESKFIVTMNLDRCSPGNMTEFTFYSANIRPCKDQFVFVQSAQQIKNWIRQYFHLSRNTITATAVIFPSRGVVIHESPNSWNTTRLRHVLVRPQQKNNRRTAENWRFGCAHQDCFALASIKQLLIPGVKKGLKLIFSTIGCLRGGKWRD